MFCSHRFASLVSGCGSGFAGGNDRHETEEETPMHINRQIERFLILHNYPASKFGRMVARDPRLVHDMRRGRELGRAMVARAKAFIAEQGDTPC
jgi:hypothetical protein